MHRSSASFTSKPKCFSDTSPTVNKISLKMLRYDHPGCVIKSVKVTVCLEYRSFLETELINNQLVHDLKGDKIMNNINKSPAGSRGRSKRYWGIACAGSGGMRSQGPGRPGMILFHRA